MTAGKPGAAVYRGKLPSPPGLAASNRLTTRKPITFRASVFDSQTVAASIKQEPARGAIVVLAEIRYQDQPGRRWQRTVPQSATTRAR